MLKLNSYCIKSQHLEKYFTDIILLNSKTKDI